ncbi:MAG: S24/S26 family peptidase [Euryarchaeota archaeon]|nr:S24/S26 family peptidase [Euryarchaeota archaeon]MBU4607566.1 S24/S26 family peptidase [Euryarchaeota archaeon]MBV1729924.1 S24/S26 family peptidase [Methanobacterium sp.]MBV1754301.1 S24/S26 family peptidase [Methanobacterium sp.]
MVLALALVAASSIALSSIEPTLNVNIQTDGSSTTVQSYTFWGMVPPQMDEEMARYAAEAINKPSSTLESIKAGVKSIAFKYNYTQVDVTIKSQFGEDQLPLPAVVKGNSMVPTLYDGQSMTVLKTADIKEGDIVVAFHPTYDLIVKRVSIIEEDRVYLISDNKEVEVTYTATSVITRTPLNTWVPRGDIIGVVKSY